MNPITHLYRQLRRSKPIWRFKVSCSVDGIHLLASAGSYVNAGVLLRSVFEVRVYLEWIFQKDTTERALLFYVWHVRNKRKWTRRFTPGTPGNLRLVAGLKHKAFEPAIREIDPAILQKEIANCDRVLAEPLLAGTNAKFDTLGDYESEWYRPGGVNDLKAMAEAVNIEAEYNGYYEWLSKLSHGLSFDDHVQLSPGEDPN